jgi:hypothetical protein
VVVGRASGPGARLTLDDKVDVGSSSSKLPLTSSLGETKA